MVSGACAADEEADRDRNQQRCQKSNPSVVICHHWDIIVVNGHIYKAMLTAIASKAGEPLTSVDKYRYLSNTQGWYGFSPPPTHRHVRIIPQ